MTNQNKFTFQLVGLEELKNDLTEVAPRVAVNILRGLMYDIGKKLRDALRSSVAVNTGKLRRSISLKRSRMKGNEIGAEVYTKQGKGVTNDGWYWHFVEYGTVHSPAQPFIRPAIESLERMTKEEMSELFTARFVKTVEREAKSGKKRK